MSQRRDVRAIVTGNGLDIVHSVTGEVLQELKVAAAHEDQRSFIISTWLKSYRGQARRQGLQEQYDKHEPSIAESRWQDCAVVTDEDGYTVYAWICGEPGSLWHIYVIPELRMYGVSKALIGMVCGATPDLARPWPFRTRSKINPYLLKEKNA